MIGISEELKNTDPDLLSPLTLAFIGDTVFDLLVRGNLVMQANRPVGKLHPLAATKVCAAAQARAAQVIASVLTEHESDIYRRGRNAHAGRVTKSARSAEYNSEPGLEALLSRLYNRGRDKRIEELFEHISNAEKADEVK